MAAGAIGYIIGQFLMLLAFSMVLVILLRLIPPLKRKPAIAYSIVGILMVYLTGHLMAVDGGAAIPTALAGLLILIVLALDLLRVLKKTQMRVA